MTIALYGRKFSHESAFVEVQILLDYMAANGVSIQIYEPFLVYLSAKLVIPANVISYDNYTQLSETNFMLSLGGDGTLLDTLNFVRDSGLPVAGINMGRLGFLASIHKEDIQLAVDSLLKGHYTIDKRALLRVENDKNLFGEVNYGLNDLTIHKKDTSSMITIHTYINGEFLNSYWADGLIISTPTGSTGYSLSCGGPIIFPKSENFVITPISPHNLNVRPIVISDNYVISFEVEGRSSNFLITLDSRTETIDASTSFAVKKESFEFNLIRLSNENYLSTLREKMMWGLDARN